MQIQFRRPLKQTTEEKQTELKVSVAQSAEGFDVDLTAEAGGENRLAGRIKLVPKVNGSQVRYEISFLGFAATGSEAYSGDAEPPFSDVEADAVTPVGHTPWIDLHELHNIAGEETSR